MPAGQERGVLRFDAINVVVQQLAQGLPAGGRIPIVLPVGRLRPAPAVRVLTTDLAQGSQDRVDSLPRADRLPLEEPTDGFPAYRKRILHRAGRRRDAGGRRTPCFLEVDEQLGCKVMPGPIRQVGFAGHPQASEESANPFGRNPGEDLGRLLPPGESASPVPGPPDPGVSLLHGPQILEAAGHVSVRFAGGASCTATVRTRIRRERAFDDRQLVRAGVGLIGAERGGGGATGDFPLPGQGHPFGRIPKGVSRRSVGCGTGNGG